MRSVQLESPNPAQPKVVQLSASGVALSRGHLDFLGRFEYFVNDDGALYRAPSVNPLDVWGYRMGARYEATPFMAHRIFLAACEIFRVESK
jgi:hypothetical protein